MAISDGASADEADGLFNQAVALHQAGRLAQAVDAYRRVVAVAPGFVGAHTNQAMALRGLGQPEAALAACDAAIAMSPCLAEAYSVRGNALLDLDRTEDALQSFEAAVAIEPANGRLQNNLGNALLRLERTELALASFDAAIALEPAYAVAHYNRGNTLRTLGDAAAAVLSFDAAVALRPGYFEAIVNRSHALSLLGRDAEALASLDTAIAINPGLASVQMNRANALMRLRRLDDALEAYDRVLALDPEHALAGWNRALTLLHVGRYREGWIARERRWSEEDYVSRSADQLIPELRERLDPTVSAEDVAGRKVLLAGEEGVGDQVLFASMIPDLLATGAEVSLLCTPRLHGLYANAFPGLPLLSHKMPRNWSPDDFDHVIALGSLGRLFRNRLEDFPGTPYAPASPAVRERWLARLGPKTTPLRVGLSWRGGSEKTGASERSIPLADLTDLLNLPGCEFVSLQYGDHRAELTAANAVLNRPIRYFEPADIHDIEELTGLAQAVDLVVTVQTSLVHLAGAAGAPCLALIPYETAWRYGTAPSSMPWYRSVTLLRQDANRIWKPIIAEVADRLRALGGG